jgi:hypothetical protein
MIAKNGPVFKEPTSQGQLKYNLKGTLVATCNFDLSTVSLFQVNNNVIENLILNISEFYPYGVEFSMDNSKLFTINRKGEMAMYNISELKENSILESRKVIGSVGPDYIGALQILDKDHILFTQPQTDKVGSIVIKDTGVYVDFNFIKLNGEDCLYGLPNFNQSYFYTPSIDFAYKEDCINHIYAFEGRDTFAAQNHTWQFTKGSKKTLVNGKNIAHQFLDTGIWQVQYVASNNQRSDTVVKNLTIEPKWQNNPLGADTFVCPNQNLILHTPPNMHCIHWQGQEPNLDTAMGAILDYNHFHQDTFVVTQKGVYSVKLTNKTFCQSWDSVVVSQAPSAEKPQISFATKELASTTKANQYRWFFNDTFLSETQNRSILPTKSGYYQLQIISEFGCQSPKSDSFFVDLSSIENLATFSFEVYPNPTNGLIILQVPQDALYKLFVYDINGKKISTQNITQTQTELNLSHLAKGVYIFKLQNSNELVATKSVVIK